MEYIGSLAYDTVAIAADIRLVIYGSGVIGRRLYAFLENNNRLDKLDCFCDANEKLWGTMYKGVLIVSPEEAIHEKKNCHFLTAGRYAEEQIRILQKGGIKNIHMYLEI